MARKARKKIFVKVSGDEYLNEKFIEWIREIGNESYVVICIGGGTQINEEFEKRGIPVVEHGPMGRETKVFEHVQLARDILELNKADLEDLLDELNIRAHVLIPVLDLAGVLTPVNGDEMVRLAYLSFDKLFVITTAKRIAIKTKQFEDLTKVKIISF